MQLVINHRGVFIGKKGDCFHIKKQDQKQEIPACSVDSILLAESATISTDAINLAFEHNIEIILINTFGDPVGRFWHAKFGSTAAIRRRQLLAYNHPLGLQIVKNSISEKLTNQRNFLHDLKKSRPAKDFIKETIDVLNRSLLKIKKLNGIVDSQRQRILGEEGYSSRCYFETLGKLVPSRYKFTGRTRRPATDPFNCYLNYAYGILYSRVTSSIVLAGMDPYLGFLHTDHYNKPSLVYDLIEPFRIIADRCVFYLFSRRQVKTCHFDKIENGIFLGEEGRKILISSFNEEMEKMVRIKKRKVQKKRTIMNYCHRIANTLLNEPELMS